MHSARFAAIILLTGAIAGLCAQSSAQSYSSYWDASEGYESIRSEDIASHVGFLAADELEGRDTPSKGLEIAAIYVVSQYERAGIETGAGNGSFFQNFELRSLEKITEPTFAEIEETIDGATTSRKYALKEDFIPFAYTGNMKVTAEIAWAGYGISSPENGFDEYASIDVRGKLALVMTHVPREKDDNALFVKDGNDVRFGGLWKKIEELRKRGALGILVVPDPNNYSPTESNRRERHELKPSGSNWPNLGSSSSEDARLLILPGDVQPMVVAHVSTGMAADILAGTGRTLDQYQTEIDCTMTPRSRAIPGKKFTIETAYEYSTVKTKNIAGTIEGSDPLLKDEWVVYVAHYDHVGKKGDRIYNGADDNASGSAALIEIAEAFAKNRQKPKRSVLFLHVSGEEKGLLGSRYYVHHPCYPLAKTVACINLDMVSRNHPDSIYVIGSDFLSKDMELIINRANEKTKLGFNYEFNRTNDPNQFFYRSDHYNFVEFGVPSVFFFSGTHEDYHQDTDTAGRIDAKKAERVARLAYLTGWGLANGENPLSRDGSLAKYYQRAGE